MSVFLKIRVLAGNPSSGGRDKRIRAQSYSQIQAILCYIRTCLKKQKQKTFEMTLNWKF